jgi:two-component system, response regulator
MKTAAESIVILMADDDEDDRFLAEDALREAHLKNEMRFVKDGEELLDYLCHRGQYANPSSCPRPGIILLDLNMPRKDGREAIEEIKRDPDLKRIPIVVLTTSQAEQDVLRTYELGVCGYITKPVSFEGLIEVMKVIGKYWFQIVELPDMQE